MRALIFVLLTLVCFTARAEPSVRSQDMQLAAPDPELWRAQRRARYMLAIGAGLAAGSAVHIAWSAPNRTCGYGHVMKTSLGFAGFTGAVGLSLGIGGGSWLAASSARHGNLRASKAQIWSAVGMSAGAFALATVFTTIVWGFDSVGCST
jgi:hypothetical protein